MRSWCHSVRRRKHDVSKQRVSGMQHASTSADGHRKPMPLEPGQVVDGKCLYCGHPVVKRHEDEEWSDQDSRFITPATDLDAHTEQVLDAAYGPKETR